MTKKIYALPGFMTDIRLWDKLKEKLGSDYEIIHLDIPVKSSFDEIVDILNEEIKDEKINLLGFSLGGYTAMYLSCKYPEKIKKVMAVGCTAAAMPDEEIEKRKQVIKMTEEFGFKGLSKKKIHTLMDKENYDNEELISLIQDMYKKAGFETFRTHLGITLDRVELGDKLMDKNINGYFFYSNGDRLVSQNWMNDFKEKAENIKFTKLNSTSHFVPFEKVDELSLGIKEFF